MTTTTNNPLTFVRDICAGFRHPDPVMTDEQSQQIAEHVINFLEELGLIRNADVHSIDARFSDEDALRFSAQENLEKIRKSTPLLFDVAVQQTGLQRPSLEPFFGDAALKPFAAFCAKAAELVAKREERRIIVLNPVPTPYVSVQEIIARANASLRPAGASPEKPSIILLDQSAPLRGAIGGARLHGSRPT